MENSIHTIKMESSKEHYGRCKKSKRCLMDQVKKPVSERRGKPNKDRNMKEKINTCRENKLKQRTIDVPMSENRASKQIK